MFINYKKKLTKKNLSPSKKLMKSMKKLDRAANSLYKCIDKHCKKTKRKVKEHDEMLEAKCRGRNVKALDKFVCIHEHTDPHIHQEHLKCIKSNCKRQNKKHSQFMADYLHIKSNK